MKDASDLPDSWQADERGRGRSRVVIGLVILAVVAIAAGAALVIAKRSKGEPKVAWPASVGGRAEGLGQVNTPAPDVQATAEPGVYAWSDFDGWHLWVVNGGEVAGAKGTITSDKDFSKAAVAVKGAGSVERDRDVLVVDLPSEPGLVGIDFEPGFYAKRLTFDLDGQDGPLAPETVTLGHDRSVDAVPFAVKKVAEADAEDA